MRELASVNDLRIRYDADSDVLYLATKPGASARSREEQPGLVWRYDASDGDLIGLTIIDFSSYWGHPRRPELIDHLASRFSLSHAEARRMLDEVA